MIFHVIDDHPIICEFVCSVIESLGHESSQFVSSMDYLNYVSRDDYVMPDAIFTDSSMPAISGPEMIRRVKAIHPEQKFVVISGRSRAEVDLDDDICAYLNKPFKSQEIAEIVRKFEQDYRH